MAAQLVHGAASRTAIAVDEPHWVTAGYVTYLLVASAATTDQWETEYDAYDLGPWGVMNPPIGKLTIGLAVAHAVRRGDVVRYLWDFSRSREENLATSMLPPLHILREARVLVAILAALCLLFVFLLATALTSRPLVALAAPTLLWASPVFRELSSVVYVDIPQLALLLGAAVAFVRHLQNSSRLAFWAALVLAGLSCATKLNAAVLVMAVIAFTFWQVIRRRAGALDLAAAGVVPIFVFIVVNPFLYPDPLGRIRYILRSWRDFYELLQTGPYRDVATLTFWQQASHMLARGVFFLDGGASLPALAPGLISAIVVSAIAWQPSLRTLGRKRSVALWLSALAAVGLAGVVPGIMAWLLGAACTSDDVPGVEVSQRRRDPIVFIAIFVLSTFVATTLWLPVDWSRYYVLTIAATALWLVRGVDRFSRVLPRTAKGAAPAAAPGSKE